jgi:hypothetical protein
MKVVFTILDDVIEEMVQNGKFAQVVHVECRLTKYRKIFKINPNERTIEVKIDSGSLNDLVEVSPMIVSDYIGEYRNPSFSEDYRGSVVHVSRGTLIAFDDTQYFRVEKDRMDYVNVESVFLLSNSKKAKNMIIDVTSKDKIVIDLPEKVYDRYYALDDAINRNVSLQILIYPAVIKALEMLADEDDRKNLKHKKWYLTFKKQLEKLGIDMSSNVFADVDEKYVIAQKLLDNPVARSFEHLYEMQEKLS